MISIFAGYDEREAFGFGVFVQSVIRNTKEKVQIIPLTGQQKDGTNAFTYERFAVPELCDWDGFAIFADASDMLAVGDVAALWNMRDESYAVQVVKHDYQTRHPRKYVGTDMETANADYPRKNWSSLILWNCGHYAHFDARKDIREAIRNGSGAYLHRFAWLQDDMIGALPPSWNWLADEYGENPNAKLLHWTAGQPGFAHYRHAPHARDWLAAAKRAQRGFD